MPRNWLVTGGCGFIGVNLIRVLKKRGDNVRILDNLSVGSREDLGAVTEFTEITRGGDLKLGRVELMVGDIRDPDIVGRAVHGIDVVVHLAAQTGVIPSMEKPRLDCDTNVIGILNVLLAVRDAGVKSFVFSSSGAPLGDQEPPANESKVPKPLSPYGASKLAGEAYSSAFYGSFDINTVALRFSNAYGPYSFKKGSVIALFFRRALAGEPLVIYGDGTQTRDFIHTDDLCQAIIKGALAEVGGEVFQIATGRETTVLELTEMIKSLIERESGKKVEIIHEPSRKGEIYRNVSDISKARRMLGYEPKVSLEEGLEQTCEWFLNL